MANSAKQAIEAMKMVLLLTAVVLVIILCFMVLLATLIGCWRAVSSS